MAKEFSNLDAVRRVSEWTDVRGQVSGQEFYKQKTYNLVLMIERRHEIFAVGVGNGPALSLPNRSRLAIRSGLVSFLPESEKGNTMTLLICLVFCLLGLLLLLLAGFLHKREPFVTLVRELGAVCFAMGLLSVAWDFGAKRASTEDLLRQFRISEQVSAAGLVGVTPNFRVNIPWAEYFQRVQLLDIHVTAAPNWVWDHQQELRDTARRKGASIRIALPDPSNPSVIAELARRAGESSQTMSDKIQATRRKFEELAREPGATGHFEIWFVAQAPLFTSYRFDDVTVLATYNHSGYDYPVPAFICQRPGSLFEFVRDDFDHLIAGPTVPGIPPAQKVFSIR